MEYDNKKSSIGWTVLGITSVLAFSFGITYLLYDSELTPSRYRKKTESDVGATITSIFTSQFPASSKFKQELETLRSSGALKTEHEVLINRWVSAASDSLKMPPAILWCLLFQESRLNHLQGIEGNRPSSGLGQFSYYSFYEVNHHLDKFTKDNLNLFMQLLGKDVRPIEAKSTTLNHPSSYYFIPTAVSASASYLNNRYYHIASILEKHKIPYDPQILWFYAAMAYNKGTRSVLSFWNEARKKGGNGKVEKLLLENDLLQDSLQDTHTLSKTMKKIWSEDDSRKYAKELKIHMANLKECVVAPELEKTVTNRIKNRE